MRKGDDSATFALRAPRRRGHRGLNRPVCKEAVNYPGLGKARTGRLWVYVRDGRSASSPETPGAWYRYTADRKGEHPQRHLQHYRGILQADA